MNSIKLYYWNRVPNLGDRLSEFIVKSISGCEVEWSESPCLFAIGSILEKAKPGDVVWGSGFRQGKYICKGIDIRAVRGPITRQMLLGYGIPCPEIYGDPALLLPRYYPIKEKVGGIGVVPHYNDYILNRGGDHLIGVRKDDLMSIVDRIVACDVIVTSALHGLIVAEAYGIPAVVLRNEQGFQAEHTIKFADYYQSTGRDNFCLTNVSVKEAAKIALDLPRPTIDLEPLVRSFPFSC